ncbi:SDR family NAD(P)-dependent oxidoreductase [Streptacidiphilus sp. EB129]|uniref:SDR family NAD(P)-dependent oxidoreductase n=1 Tax=Streptacidiphilus sp. EB129 TaxID=3156262 RepID=UPI0035116F13
MSDTPALSSLTALVVDGATGPGRIVSIRLSAAGLRVAVVTVEEAVGATYLCKELAELGLTALPYRVCPFDADDAERVVSEVTEDLGQVDILVDLLPEDGFHEPATALGRAVLNGMAVAGHAGRVMVLRGASRRHWETVLAEHPSLSLDLIPAPGAAVDGDVADRSGLSTAEAVLLLLGIQP